MNKKGLLAEGMMDFFLILAFIFLFVVFFFLMGNTEGKISAHMNSKSSYNDAQNTLLICLKSPVDVNGETMTLAELISRSTLDSSYESLIKEKTLEVLSYNKADIDSYKRFGIRIQLPNKVNTDDYDYIIGVLDRVYDYKVGEVMVPNNNGELIGISIWDSSDGKIKADYSFVGVV